MSLVDKDIKRLMESGNIVIDPFKPKQLGSNTYDLRLGKTIFKPNMPEVCIIDPIADKSITQIAKVSTHSVINYTELSTPYVLKPGEFILACTKERIGCHGNIIGEVYGRSGGSRLGLVVDTGPYIDTGFEGYLTLAIKNNAPYSILLQENYRIAHIEFTQTSGDPDVSYDKRKLSKYAGKQMEEKPLGWILDKEWR